MMRFLRLLPIIGIALVAAVLGAQPAVTSTFATAPSSESVIVYTVPTGPAGEGRSAIEIQNADGTGRGILTDNHYSHENPRISSDASQVVYRASRVVNPGSSNPYIETEWVIIDVATGQEREFPVENADAPEWSADGEKFSFAYNDGQQYGYATANVDGSDLQWLTGISGPAASPDRSPSAVAEGYYHPTTPVWSPDGSQLAYVELDAIHVIDADGNNKQQIAGNCDCRALDWSPDGTRLVGMRNAGNQWRVSVINLADGAIADVPISGEASYPAWSPDGSQIVYQEAGYQAGDFASVVIINADGSGAHTMADLAYQPDWGGQAPLVDGVEFTQVIQELQTVSQLQADLEGDGQPPVPMVAGKPAAMRIYFGEVLEDEGFIVEVSGEFSGSSVVELSPGCTPADRRRQTAGCSSTDFFFTPPQGDWSVRLVVKNIFDEVLFDEEFRLTSVTTNPLIIKYRQVCVSMTTGAAPTCPSATILAANGLLRKLLPVSASGLGYGQLPVPPRTYSAPVEATALIADLNQDYNLTRQGSSFLDQLVGWVPLCGAKWWPSADATGQCRAGWSDPRWVSGGGVVSWGVDTNSLDPTGEQVLAHEVAHNLSLRHPNLPDGCGAVDPNTDWAYADSTIQEVGFDVTAIPPAAVAETKLDIESYCWTPPSNTWISPFHYKKLLEGNFVPHGFGVSPAGASIQQLVVKGSALADGSAATIESAYVITSATPADQPNPLGNYCLRTSGGAALDYCFQLNFQEHQSGAPIDSESFSLRMPLPVGTTHVSLAKGFQELDALELSASAPSVDVTEPDELSGEETIDWSASDGDGDLLKYALMYTPDDGQTWYPIAVDITDSEFTFDSSYLEGDEVRLRVLASDGLNTTIETTDPIEVVHGESWGDNNCSGEADPVDALLALHFDAGQSTNTGDCPAMAALVTAGGEERLWGDVDCSGDVGLVDGLKLLRFHSGLSVAQGPGCPAIGVLIAIERR